MFDIGSSLREARLRQELDFPELEERTKIRPKYLRALEDERFDILPAPTYVRGFLRSYAEALGLDGQPFVDEYNSRFTVGEDDAPLRARRAPAPRRDRGPRESRMAAVALVAIAIATALVIAAWKFGGPEGEAVLGLQGTTRRVAPTPRARSSSSARRAGTRGWRCARARPRGSFSTRARSSAVSTSRSTDAPFSLRSARRTTSRWVNGNRVELRDGPTSSSPPGTSRGPPLEPTPAAIVVTGPELVRGERNDRNGPFLAAEVVRLGLEPERIAIVGDGAQAVRRRFASGFAR